MKEIIVNGFKISIQTPAITYLMFMYASFMFLAHTISYLWPVAMKTNFGTGETSPFWYVMVLSCLTFTFLGSKGLEQLLHAKNNSNKEGMANSTTWLWFAFVALIMSVPIFHLGLETRAGNLTLLLFIGSVALCKFGYGFLRPCYEILVNHYIPVEHSEERATIMSFASMLVSALVILLMIPAAGRTGEATTVGWLIPSGILILFTLVFHVLMRRYQKKIGELPTKSTKPSEVV